MRRRAFTLIELLVAVAGIAVLAAVILLIPDRTARPALRTLCLARLHQNNVAWFAWSSDHNGLFPWQVSSTNGGTMESIASGNVFPHFRALAGYKFPPANFVCKADKSRQAADDVLAVNNTNVSYFLNVDASTNHPSQTTILSGDRNLELDGKPAGPGLRTISAAHSPSWTSELHPKGGNLAFADGHVEIGWTNQLNDKLREQDAAVSRWVIP